MKQINKYKIVDGKIYMGTKPVNLINGNIITHVYLDKNIGEMILCYDYEQKHNEKDTKYLEDCKIWDKLFISISSVSVKM